MLNIAFNIIFTIITHYITYLILGILLILIFYKLTDIYYNMDCRHWAFNWIYAVRWIGFVLGILSICTALVLYRVSLYPKQPIIQRPDPPTIINYV